MKHIPALAFIPIFLLLTFQAQAIKPTRTYAYTPQMLDLEHEVIRLETEDGTSLNVWHLPSSESSVPVIISQSDAGNMGDWLYLGLYLQAYGLDVWMYDYRGFGESDDFKIITNQLFHMEFINDLDAVAGHVFEQTGKAPVLIGLSMGTIIVNEFIRKSDIPVEKVVFDGYVANPRQWIGRLAEKGKAVTLPEGYRNRKYRPRGLEALFIVSEKDSYSGMSDIPKAGQDSHTVKTFDCGHISGFFHSPVEYAETIVSFING